MALEPSAAGLETEADSVDGCLVMTLVLVVVVCAIRVGVGLIRREAIDQAVIGLSVLGGGAALLVVVVAVHALREACRRR